MPRGKTKGVGKTSAAARSTAAAAASAASAAASPGAAAARLPPAEGTRPATRSSPDLEPDATAASRTSSDQANAGSQTRAADAPRIDSPSGGADATINEADQLRATTESLRAELDAARQRLHDLELSVTGTTRAGTDRPPSARMLPHPFVPPVPPPTMLQCGMISVSQGLVEVLCTLSVSASATRMPGVLAQAVHVFPMPPGGPSPTYCQETAHYHFLMTNFLEGKLLPLPTTWPDFSTVLVAAVRQQMSTFGVHATQDFEQLMRFFEADLNELRDSARLANFDRGIDASVIYVFIQALRNADPMAIFTVVGAEIMRLRRAISDSQLMQPTAGLPFDRRGRGAGGPFNPQSGNAAGGVQPSLEQSTFIEHTTQHGFIRKMRRGQDGGYPAAPRCFRCGSLQHRLEGCKTLTDAAARWVQLAEPSQ